MVTLTNDWLTEGLVDYEYKKYILLAYLKDVKQRFHSSELFPFLSDLVFHYRNLQNVKQNKELLYENFPKSISKADFRKLEFTYERIAKDSEVMGQIEDIIAFALPQMQDAIDFGKELYEFVEENMEVEPVGLTPIYASEGYFFVNQDASRKVSIYRYQLSVFERSDEKYRALNTTYIAEDFSDFSRSYEQIKLDLSRSYWELPNPATFLVVSKFKFPFVETVLPVAKRILVRTLASLGM